MIGLDGVRKDTARAVVEASSHWREDQLACWKNACEKETLPRAKWAMENFIKNAEAADRNHSALCDDTGTPILFWRSAMKL